ncbi:hypothetical protein LFML04_0988 [Leptospirillum ferriphilum ML-04]|uniref:Uncharacterized protein n=1 Tax=Leptospirillum ferriphilum (strain ML-04) TaxID=1048260 RepID=J9Z9Q4_LEPFM|nr:hypothetical protein LFML04_0988 [Leptospirillum ferriphilum ML-04]
MALHAGRTSRPPVPRLCDMASPVHQRSCSRGRRNSHKTRYQEQRRQDSFQEVPPFRQDRQTLSAETS